MIPVSAANLPDGRILAWASNERTSFPAGPEFTHAAVWDPQTGSFTEIPHPNHDMFCSHHVMLEDGRVFISGGRNQGNSPWTSTFDHETNQWVQHPNMNRGRWYPTSVALPNGEVMTMIGSGGGNTAEKWDGTNTWNYLGNLNFDSPILNYNHGERNWWPLLHLAPDGRIFHSGPTPDMHYIDASGNGAIEQTNNHTAWYPKHGTAVMYEEGKILSAGGWTTGSNLASVADAMVIDLNGPSPQIRTVASMNFPRKFQNGVTLANGEVLIVGGNTSGQKFNDSGTVYPVELWNPDTETFRVGAAMAVPRNYHSVALLMVDGRVFSGGGGLCNCAADHQDGQIYTPPYLFNADGTPATRPVITQIAGVVENGQSVAVQATPGMDKFTMVKMSSTTHAVNSDLRFLSVPFTESGAGSYTLTLNNNVNVLTPGYWMLFALNAQGTPSVAKIVKVSTQGLEVGPPTIKQMGDMNTGEGQRVDLTLIAGDPDGDPISFSATNLPAGLSLNASSGVISGVVNAAGTYNVTITVADGSEGTAQTTFVWTVYDASQQPGWMYEYFEGNWDLLPDFDALVPQDVGQIDNISLAPRGQDDFFGFRYRAILRVDTAGQYTFYTTSDDGSRLYIDGALVVDNDGLHGSREISGQINLSEGLHEIVVTFFEKGGAANLSVDWAGPGIARQAIPTSSVTLPVKPETLSARHVRLLAFSEVNGKNWTSAAEINLVDGSDTLLNRSGWTVSADSSDTGSGGVPGQAIDGNANTIWHTEWSVQAGDDLDPPHPHWFAIDTGAPSDLKALRYLPRNSGVNGNILKYAVHVSADGVNWGYPVAFGDMSPGGSEKTIELVSEPEPPANTAPTLADPGDQNGEVGEVVTLPLVGSDPDGDSLTYAASNLPGGLTINTASGVVSGTLNTAGTFTTIFSVDDGLDSAQQTITWIVDPANLPPTITNPGAQNNVTGDVISLAMQASDPNGDALTFSAGGLPAGASIDSGTGLISGTLGAVGSYTTTVSVSVGELTEQATFAWTVVEQNFPPTLSAIANQTNDVGDSVSVLAQATDPNGDTLTYGAIGLPPGLTIGTGSGLIQGSPSTAGTYNPSITASDGALTDQTSFVWTINEVLDPIVIGGIQSPPQPIDTPIGFDVSATGGGTLEYSWSFGDGSGATAFSTSSTAQHTYAAAGRYLVTVTVRNAQDTEQLIFTQAVHLPHTANAARSDATILVESQTGSERVWNVNPDNDSVAVVDGASMSLVAEIPVGDFPNGLAIVGSEVWVSNKHGGSLTRISIATLGVLGTIDVGAGAEPHGLVANPVSGHVYVALEGMGQIAEFSAGGSELSRMNVGEHVRHVSVSGDGTRLYASRFITPLLPGEDTTAPSLFDGGVEQGGEVMVIDAASGSILSTLALTHSNVGVSEHSGPGLPNYLRNVAVSPDGVTAFVPSKQDNILAGTARNGFVLDHDHTVRAVVSHVDLGSGSADVNKRVDVDNASIASAAAFGAYGSYVFVALEGNRMVSVLDAYRQEELFRFPSGRAPRGLVMGANGTTLYVHNFMERTISAHDLTDLIMSGTNGVTPLGSATVVGSEALTANILLGKQHFYDALDPRLTLESYMACAACHSDGGQDGRVWDFSQFGEGLRSTTTLNGQRGSDAGPVHWTGNFDELQDFEGQIRSFARGLGLMSDTDFNAGTRSEPLGDPKAGLSADLDALAAYVNSLDRVGASPNRDAGGALTSDAVIGKALFYDNGCGSCHADAQFSDSAIDVRHDIGSLTAASGGRLGGPLDGLDTPTLKGLWKTAPYLHDGSAATIEDAIAAHTSLSLTGAERASIAAYLSQLDDAEAFDPPGPSLGPLLETFKVGGVSSSAWTTVSLGRTYDDPVVVCTIENTANAIPQVVRMQHTNDEFQIRLQNPSNAGLGAETVNCMAVEAGAWTLPDGRHIEARAYNSTRTDENNSWLGEAQSPTIGFTSPVVIGQIMSFNDPDWSVFWSRGASRTAPPSASAIYTGLSVAEDTDVTRASERVGYIILEAGAGNVDGSVYETAVGGDTVLGWADSTAGYTYTFGADMGASPVIIASQTAEDGGNGGWAVLRGTPSGSSAAFSIDEDQVGDTERNHTTEQVAYFATAGEVQAELTAYVPPVLVAQSHLEVLSVGGVTDGGWTAVDLTHSYTNLVAVCTVADATNGLPQVVRMREVSGSRFEVRLQNPSGSALTGAETLGCMALEAGAWELADGRRIEAQKYGSTIVDENNSWAGESQTYLQAYGNPVVIGQVMSYNDAGWSTFWARGSSRGAIPSAASLFTGHHVGEDPSPGRASETIGFIVLESGPGTASGVSYEAAVGSDTVRGWDNSATGYSYSLANAYAAPPVIVASLAAMDGGDGGWAVTRSRSTSSVNFSADEDQQGNAERSHTTEQVGYVAIEAGVLELFSEE